MHIWPSFGLPCSDVSPETVVAWRLLGRDAWPGTWLERSVAAVVYSQGRAVRSHRRRRRGGHSRCRRQRRRRHRRRFGDSSRGVCDGDCGDGALFLSASGEGGGARGGVRGRLNSYLQ